MPRVTEGVHVGGQAVNGGLVGSKQTAVAQRKRAQHGAASAGRRGQAVQLARATLSKEAKEQQHEQQAVAKEVQVRGPRAGISRAFAERGGVMGSGRSGFGRHVRRLPHCGAGALMYMSRMSRERQRMCFWRSGASVAWAGRRTSCATMSRRWPTTCGRRRFLRLVVLTTMRTNCEQNNYL